MAWDEMDNYALFLKMMKSLQELMPESPKKKFQGSMVKDVWFL